MLMITILSSSAMAAELEPIEVGPYPGNDITSQINLDDVNVDAIIQDMIQTHTDSYEMTEEDYIWAQNVIELYNSNESKNFSSTRASFDDNWYKLRYGNLIELTLDLDEGISNSVALDCLNLSRTAETEAKNNFSNYQDSAQHFIWNFKMTVSQSKTIARTIGNNHEWGIAMINPMLTYHERMYNQYIQEGYSENEAANKALAKTVFYIPQFKYDTVCIMQASYDFFNGFFTDESKMDFWNNCYGRAYPEKGYTSGVVAFRYSAFTKRELVLDGTGSGNMAANLTENQKQSIWSWDWYSY